ncbi:MAG TPA: SCO family protein [Streptosporangiaceae bacterium]
MSVLAGAALVVTGCGTSSATGESPVRIQTPAATTPVKGDPLDPPITMPAATLTDTAGKPYDLRARTKGRITLLFIGFTHCEDVCPTTMADIAQALRKLPAAERNEISVVFVTADPWRDTPRVIRRWLDNFDRSFIGLTGSYPTLRRFAKACHVFIAPPSGRSGDYQIQHGAQTLIFDRDHEARELFTANPTPADLAHDLRYTLKS